MAAAVEFPPFEGAEVQKLFQTYNEVLSEHLKDPGKDAATEAAVCTALHSLLVKHPFIKARTSTHETAAHTFDLVGFSCDVWRFRNWLKTADGKPFKAKAGGLSDDGLYTISSCCGRRCRAGCI